MKMAERRKLGSFTKHVEDIIIKSNYDEDLIQAMIFHISRLKETDITHYKSIDEYWKGLISIMFINQMSDYKRVSFVSDIDENKDWPVPVVPVEHFFERKPSKEYRKKVFIECLEDFDILNCSIASISKSSYILRVIHKYGVPRVLEDLNVLVTMSKDKRNKKVYHPFDFIRVVVLKINREVGKGNDPEIWVTDDDSILKAKIKPKIGLINEEDLPFYVYDPPDLDVVPTYADYLKCHSRFNRPSQVSDVLHTCFGVDPCKIFSFYHSFENFKCSEEETGQTLLVKSKLRDAKNLFLSAFNNFNSGNLDQALIDASKGIEFCPNERLGTSKLYVLRSKILKSKSKMCQQSVQDLIEAKKLNKNDPEINQLMAQHCSRAALILYHKENYELAAKFVDYSLTLDKENSKVLHLQKCIKKKLQAMNI